MGIIGGYLGYLILQTFKPRITESNKGNITAFGDKQITDSFGNDFFNKIAGKVVIDFGCGLGFQAIEMAQRGATRVIGIDIQEDFLKHARELAHIHKVAEKCVFCVKTEEKADIIVSKDAFEHFDDPGIILLEMRKLLKSNGYVLVAFGRPWLHPYGGHLFSVFPWTHLIFTEKSLIRWRSDFKSDGATRFKEVAGGLNQITIREFEKIVERSPFRFSYMENIPIKRIKIFKSRVLREFGTSVVRCKLVPKY